MSVDRFFEDVIQGGPPTTVTRRSDVERAREWNHRIHRALRSLGRARVDRAARNEEPMLAVLERPVERRELAKVQDDLYEVIDSDASANVEDDVGEAGGGSEEEKASDRLPQVLRVPERDFFLQPLSEEQKEMVRQAKLPPDPSA